MPHAQNQGRGRGGGQGRAQGPIQRLARQTPTRRLLGLSDYRADGDLQANTPNEESDILERTIGVPFDVRDDRPFRVAIPAHETFTEDGAINTETLNLSFDLIDCPAMGSDVVAFEGGTTAAVSNIDNGANTVDVDTDGNGNTIDVFYAVGDPATITVEKRAPRSQGQVRDELYEDVLNLVHQKNQNEDPEHILTPTPTGGVFPSDFRLAVTIDAPYDVELDPITRTNGDAVARNAVLQIPVKQAKNRVDGLGREIARRMVTE